MFLFVSEAGNTQFLTCHPDFFQSIEGIVWHTGGQVNQAVIIVDTNAADVFTGDVCLIGDGADNVTGHDPMIMTHSKTVTLHAFGGWSIISVFL